MRHDVWVIALNYSPFFSIDYIKNIWILEFSVTIFELEGMIGESHPLKV